MDYEKKYKDALERAKEIKGKILQSHLSTESCKAISEYIDTIIPELHESEDERVRHALIEFLREAYSRGNAPEECAKWLVWLDQPKEQRLLNISAASEWLGKNVCRYMNSEYNEFHKCVEYDGSIDKEKLINDFEEAMQKEQRPIIQDVELNDAVYDYVRDYFIASADFTPEYIKKLMENAFFAGVDYYLLKQESESCEPDTNVEKVIEDVIRVYGKTQGEWVGGYDVDTLIVNLRRAFNKKEQKPLTPEEKVKHPLYIEGFEAGKEIGAQCEKVFKEQNPSERFTKAREEYEVEWSEEGQKLIDDVINILCCYQNTLSDYQKEIVGEEIRKLKSLRPSWTPSKDEERLINTSISFLKDFADKGYENAVECIGWLKSKLNGNACK